MKYFYAILKRLQNIRFLPEFRQPSVKRPKGSQKPKTKLKPAVELDVRGVTITVADPPINCGPPLFVETQAAVNRLKRGKNKIKVNLGLNWVLQIKITAVHLRLWKDRLR